MLWNKILLIYDGTENALRATEFVAKMFGKTEGVKVTIFGLYDKIPRHDLKDTSPVVDKLQRQISSMEIEIERGQARIKESKALLARAGMNDDFIGIKYIERKQSAIKDVMAEAEQGGYGTIVVGRGESGGLLAGGNVAKELANQIKDRCICLV
jgi:hypothetical protein